MFLTIFFTSDSITGSAFSFFASALNEVTSVFFGKFMTIFAMCFELKRFAVFPISGKTFDALAFSASSRAAHFYGILFSVFMAPYTTILFLPKGAPLC